MIYFKAYHLAFTDGRIASDQLASLVEEGKDIVTMSAGNEALLSSRLGFHVIEQVKRQLHKLEGCQQEAQAHLKEHGEFVHRSLSISEISALYAKFQQLTVILPEEEFLLFLRDGDALSAQVKEVSSQTVPWELKDVELLMDRIQTLVSNEVVDIFDQVKPIKQEYEKLQEALGHLYRDADKRWSVVSSVLEDLDRGVAASHEVLVNLLNTAQASKITNADVSKQAEDALAAGLAKEEIVTSQLAELAQGNADMRSILPSLHSDIHHFAINSSLFTVASRRIETCELIMNCRSLLDSKSTDVQELRDCRHRLFRLIQQHLQDDQTSIEYQMLMTVKDSFIEYSFLQEATSILSGKLSISANLTDKLLQKSADVLPALRTTSEFLTLQSEVTKTKTCVEENKSLHDALESLIQSTTFTLNSMDVDGDNAASSTVFDLLQQINLSDLLTHETFSHVIIPALQQLQVSLDALGQKMYSLSVHVQSLIVAKEEEAQKLTENMATLHTLCAVANLICRLPSLLSSQPQYLLSEHKDLVAYVNKMATYQEKYNRNSPETPTNILIYSLHIISKLVSTEVGLWMERAQAVVPMRSVRNKNKYEAKGVTIRDLKDLTDSRKFYIAFVCRTAVHIRIEEILGNVEAIKQKLLSFLVNTSYMAEIPEGGEEAVFKHIRSNLKDYLETIGGMQSDIELLPVDLPESVLMQWLNDLLGWLDHVPFPFETSKNVYEDDEMVVLTLEESQQKLQEGLLLVNQVPAPVITELNKLQVMERDAATNAVVGFKRHILPAIKWSGDVYTYLSKMTVVTKQYQQRVQLMIKTESGNLTPAVLQQLIEESKRLVVQPDVKIKKELEKCLSSKPTGGKKSKPVPLLDDDGYFREIDDPYAPVSLAPKPKVIKPVLIKAKCILCNKDIKDKRENYCSADCVYAYLPLLFKQYMSYKHTLSNLANLAVTDKQPLAENDYRAFSIKDKCNLIQTPLPSPQPTQLPTASEEALHTKNAMAKLVNTTNDGLSIMRSKARSSWEDFFTTLLPRLKIEGSSFLALLLANELEEASFVK